MGTKEEVTGCQREWSVFFPGKKNRREDERSPIVHRNSGWINRRITTEKGKQEQEGERGRHSLLKKRGERIPEKARETIARLV